jgi:endonuclease YncB( thermonuclease family)
MVHATLIFKLIIFLLCFTFAFSLQAQSISGKAKIIDGDTIHISKNKIRLHGIDAPEWNQSCMFNNQYWECGKKATYALEALIADKIVVCEIKDIDRYKRYIAICFYNKINLNKFMVINGWAVAYRYYSKDYIDEEFIAKKNRLGIWKGEFQEPYQFRKKNK